MQWRKPRDVEAGSAEGYFPGPTRAHSPDAPPLGRGCDGEMPGRLRDCLPQDATSPHSSFLLPEEHGPGTERSLARRGDQDA